MVKSPCGSLLISLAHCIALMPSISITFSIICEITQFLGGGKGRNIGAGVIFPPFREVAPHYQESAVRPNLRRLFILFFLFL